MRRIFAFWESDKDMPGYLKLCIKTWYKNIKEIEVHFINHSNLEEYLPGIYSLSQLKKLSYAKQSDVISVALLEKYGGLFIDVDTIIVNDIFNTFDQFESKKLLAFGDPIQKWAHIAILYCKKPNNPILKAWRVEAQKRLQNLPTETSWDYVGNDILNPLFKIEKYQDYFEIIDRSRVGNILESILKKELNPQEGYRTLYFEDNDNLSIKDSLNYVKYGVISLHNSWTPREYMSMSETQVFNDNRFLSKLISYILKNNDFSSISSFFNLIQDRIKDYNYYLLYRFWSRNTLVVDFFKKPYHYAFDFVFADSQYLLDLVARNEDTEKLLVLSENKLTTNKVRIGVYQNIEDMISAFKKATISISTQISNFTKNKIDLNSILMKQSSFISKGHHKNIVYYDFKYKDIKYAYDVVFDSVNDLVRVDFLVRESRIYIKKMSQYLSFDTPNKIKNVMIGDLKDDSIIAEILEYNKKIESVIDSIVQYQVSVIVTNYNREKKILECLDSLKKQKNDGVSYEVIIIDDFSSDQSLDTIKKFIEENRLTNFRLFKRDYNFGGPSLPRNDGINIAKGEYIYFVDSDDIIDEYAVKNSYHHAKKNNSDICLMRVASKSRAGYARSVFLTGTIGRAHFFENRVYNNPLALHLFKTKFLLQNRIMFDLEHNTIEDLIFVSHCFSKTNNISILADREYYFLSDYSEGDNISLHGGGGYYKSLEAFMKCLNYYLIARDSLKYSSFLNLLIAFIRPWLIGKVPLKIKINIIDVISGALDKSLVDYRYINDGNMIDFLNICNKSYDAYTK